VHDSDPTDPESVVTSTGTLRATVTPTRTGRRPARETAQAYARDRVTSATWTDREVKAFTQVGVEPGEWVEVMILVPAGDCTVVVARDPRRRTG